jgi:hypothetical protein
LTASAILGVVYGMDDCVNYVTAVDKALRVLAETANASYIGMYYTPYILIVEKCEADGMEIVDIIPICKYENAVMLCSSMYLYPAF